MLSFLDVPAAGAYHLVTLLISLTHPVVGELSAGLAIVLFTVAVRLLLHPLARAAARGERTRAELAPQVAQLRRKHGADRDRLARELAVLQQEAGGSMFAGCLPMLLQLPFFSVMYRLFSSPAVHGQPNALLGHTLFGTPLGAHLLTSAGGWPVFAGLFAALAAVAWCTVRWQAGRAAAGPDAPQVPKVLALLPFGTVLFAALLPLAAGIYLLTTTAWTFLERRHLASRAR